MKTLNFTYDVYSLDGKEKVCGETCMDITMQDDFAEKFLNDTAMMGDKVLVKSIIIANELLKGRTYVNGSIKCVKEDRRINNESKN